MLCEIGFAGQNVWHLVRLSLRGYVSIYSMSTLAYGDLKDWSVYVFGGSMLHVLGQEERGE